MVEPTGIGERRGQRVLPGMTERRMAEIVGKTERLGQILVQPERASHGSADLGDLDRMGQPDAKMIAVRSNEYLGLIPQPAEGSGMDDAVAVALKSVAWSAWAIVRLRMGPTAR